MGRKPKEKAPSFQFYPKDWLSSPAVIMMTPAQRGGYIQLLCLSWVSDNCDLPADDVALAALSGLGSEWESSKDLILQQFDLKGIYYVNNRLFLERKKQKAYREKKAKSGSKGGKAKRDNELQAKNKGSTTTLSLVAKRSSSTATSTASAKKPPYSPPRGNLGLESGANREAFLHETLERLRRIVDNWDWGIWYEWAIAKLYDFGEVQALEEIIKDIEDASCAKTRKAKDVGAMVDKYGVNYAHKFFASRVTAICKRRNIKQPKLETLQNQKGTP